MFTVICVKYVELKTTLLFFALCISYGMVAQEVPFMVTVNELDFNEPAPNGGYYIRLDANGKQVSLPVIVQKK